MKQIDKSAVILTLQKMVYGDLNTVDLTRKQIKALNDAIAILTIEQKRGRWVKMTGMMPPEYHGHYECSECQWHMKGLRNSWTREEEMAYCPNCGAKMEEVEE